MYPFGYGLSYTTFSYNQPELSKTSISTNEEASLKVSVTNTGDYDGEEVVQLYLQKPDDKEGPLFTLRGFQRVFIPKGETVEVEFLLTEDVLEWWNADAQRMTPWPAIIVCWLVPLRVCRIYRKLHLLWFNKSLTFSNNQPSASRADGFFYCLDAKTISVK